MAFQFIHVEVYAQHSGRGGKSKGQRKRTASEIVAEAERLPGSYEGHVEEMVRPTLLDGVWPKRALDHATDVAKSIKDKRGRRLRKDAPIIMAGVISCPPDFDEDAWEKLLEDSVKFLRAKFGERLKAVVEHLDEPKRHVHFFVVPQYGERISDVHPGHAAKRRLGRESGMKKANAAYIDAMRAFQDDYYQTVAQFNGLARIGPARRRLSRAEWCAEKAVLEAQRKTMALCHEVTEARQLQAIDQLAPVGRSI